MYKKGYRIEYNDKKCKVCSQIKPISEFYSRTDRTCKQCRCKINSEKAYQKHLALNPDLPNEIWKDVVGYEGLYKVSNLGRIRSFVLGGQNGCILALATHKQGYKRIRLLKKMFLVHRLVAEAFISNPQNKFTINHKDGNKGNNCVSNLEWATQSENNKHAFKTGLKLYTEEQLESASKGRKISTKQVLEIRNLFNSGKSLSEISLTYDVSKAQICRIVNYKSRSSI